MILHLVLAILLFNFSLIQSSNNIRIHLESNPAVFTDLDDEENSSSSLTTQSFSKVKMITSNTLMIDTDFQGQWIILILVIDNLLPKISQSRFKLFPYVDPQTRLQCGISNNDPRTVKTAIDEGANFLKDFPENKIKTINQSPIEYAVKAGKTRALRTMLDHMISIPRNLMNDFLGGLLIKAVQAGQLASIKLLIRNYETPYIANSFLLQKAVMHRASKYIIEYLMKKFMPHPELFKLYGKNKDSLLHLAIRFNNFDAFVYFYHREDIHKHILNANSLEPIDLLAILPFKSDFFEKLIKKHPEILTNWTDEYGNGLLHLAAHHNKLIFTKRLVKELNFPVDRKNHEQLTPILVAYYAAKRDISLFLARKGADVFHKDSSNLNILMHAVNNRDFKFFKSLLETINPNEAEESLKNLSDHLIKEEKHEALIILHEFFPFLNKELI